MLLWSLLLVLLVVDNYDDANTAVLGVVVVVGCFGWLVGWLAVVLDVVVVVVMGLIGWLVG